MSIFISTVCEIVICMCKHMSIPENVHTLRVIQLLVTIILDLQLLFVLYVRHVRVTLTEPEGYWGKVEGTPL